jgi:predicted RNA-binding protein associated with RNAse of E/G family
MNPPPFIVHKLDAAGREVWRYPAEVLETGPSHIVLQAFFDRDDSVLHGIRLRRGDRFVENFYTDRWYNVFAVYDVETAAFKGWYCNIARPAAIAPDGLTCEDLALDLLVFPNGQSIVLDRDEFEALALSVEERQRALLALEELRRMARRGEGPFTDRRPGPA